MSDSLCFALPHEINVPSALSPNPKDDPIAIFFTA